MNIYIISNTRFGYRNRILEQLDYFYNQFIPFVERNKSDRDIVIHLGNVFNTKNSINFKTLNSVYSLFETLSSKTEFYLVKGLNDIFSIDMFKKINNLQIIDKELVIEDYLFFNNDYLKDDMLNRGDYKKCFSGFFENGENGYENIINVFSSFQLMKNYNNNGFYWINDDINFIENNYSSCYREIIVENVEQLKSIENFKKDILDIKISSRLINKKEVIQFLSNYKINTIEYSDSIEDNDIITDNNISDVKDVVLKYLTDNQLDLNDEVQKVFKIRNKKIEKK